MTQVISPNPVSTNDKWALHCLRLCVVSISSNLRGICMYGSHKPEAIGGVCERVLPCDVSPPPPGPSVLTLDTPCAVLEIPYKTRGPSSGRQALAGEKWPGPARHLPVGIDASARSDSGRRRTLEEREKRNEMCRPMAPCRCADRRLEPIFGFQPFFVRGFC